MRAPLTGLRVLDLSRLLPGPFATMVLRDLGASVDKVEDTAGGDYLRVMPPLAGPANAAFEAMNRGKRSLAIDLKHPEGRAAFLSLVPKYDVLVESFRPGVMAKLGLGYDTLKATHPGLIYVALSGYGATGPLAHRAGHDVNFLARAGVLGLTGPAGGTPGLSGAQMADIGGGALYAVVGTLAALEGRRHTGEGAFVDIALSEGAMSLGFYGIAHALAGVGFPRGEDPLMGGIAPYGIYAASDGVPVALAALEPKFWIAFATAVGIEPDMEALVPGPHQPAWKARIAGIVGARPSEAWRGFSEAHDCCLEVAVAPEALPTDPQHAARGMFARAEANHAFQPRTPFSREEQASPPAPGQGQHSREILVEAGVEAARVDALLAAGLVRTG